MNRRYAYANHSADLADCGAEPFIVNIDRATRQNCNYRTALWTGKHLQLTLMSIPPGGDIGLESHPHLDQFIRIEDGFGLVRMGNSEDKLNYQMDVWDGFAVFVPAGTWHNIINTGNKPIKLYSVYAPPGHPHGTVHTTKEDAEHEEHTKHGEYEKHGKIDGDKADAKPEGYIEPEAVVKPGKCEEPEEYNTNLPSDSL